MLKNQRLRSTAKSPAPESASVQLMPLVSVSSLLAHDLIVIDDKRPAQVSGSSIDSNFRLHDNQVQFINWDSRIRLDHSVFSASKFDVRSNGVWRYAKRLGVFYRLLDNPHVGFRLFGNLPRSG